jgi:hypothetical protein
LALLAASAPSRAVVLFGSLSNFDVVNDTGQDAYGFEIELDGLSGIGYSFSANRYGAPRLIPFSGGVYVRYGALWDAARQQWTQANVSVPQLAGAGPATVVDRAIVPTLGHQCVYWLPNYATSGCDHFGLVLPYYSPPPSQVVYRWLWANPDPLHAGEFVYAGTQLAPPTPTAAAPLPPPPPPAVPIVAIPQPVFAVPAAQPDVVAAQIEAPKPPNPELQFGEAQWVKVFKTELPREVGLEELQSDNPAVVPEDPAQVETAWKLLQHNPHNPDSGSSVLKSQSKLGSGSRAVVRRYEFYKFTGAYDPVDHGAICADIVCNAPADGELGGYIGAQMAAANVGNPQVTVTKIGTGTVSGSLQGVNRTPISCGSACAAAFNLQDVVVLTASPPSNGVFVGWQGACSGAQSSCTLTVTDEMAVTARFATQFTLSVGRGGSGTVTGTPAGNDRSLNCGSACSAKFTQGTAVALTATPPAGHRFVNWTGSGAGICNLSTTPTCTVTVTQDTSIQANFQ